MHPELAEFISRLEGTTDADQTWTLTLDYVAQRGVQWLHHAYTAPFWRADQGFWYRRSSIPQWWDERYNARRYFVHDPGPRHCRRSSAPFLSGLGMDDGRCSPEANQIFAESAEWGARCTVTFPLRNLPGSPLGAMVCITGMKAREFRRWWSAFGGELHLAALAADARLLQFFSPPEAVADLSARERECLLLLAMGLRTDRIAYRLNISTAAVDLYFANARRKLGARTRDQALLKAVMLGRLVP